MNRIRVCGAEALEATAACAVQGCRYDQRRPGPMCPCSLNGGRNAEGLALWVEDRVARRDSRASLRMESGGGAPARQRASAARVIGCSKEHPSGSRGSGRWRTAAPTPSPPARTVGVTEDTGQSTRCVIGGRATSPGGRS